MGPRGFHLQVHPLLLHCFHAGEHLHPVRDVSGPLRGHRPRQEVLVHPGGEACPAGSAADLGAVSGHGSACGSLPEHRGERGQHHLLLGGLAGPPEEGLRAVHLRFWLPPASGSNICLLCKGGYAARLHGYMCNQPVSDATPNFPVIKSVNISTMVILSEQVLIGRSTLGADVAGVKVFNYVLISVKLYSSTPLAPYSHAQLYRMIFAAISGVDIISYTGLAPNVTIFVHL